MSTPDGNYCEVTGTTQINTMGTTDIDAGTFITLGFSTVITIKNQEPGTGAEFMLSGYADFTTVNKSTLTVVYDGTDWREVARTTTQLPV
jgi:hypothetical protein